MARNPPLHFYFYPLATTHSNSSIQSNRSLIRPSHPLRYLDFRLTNPKPDRLGIVLQQRFSILPPLLKLFP